MVDHPSLTLNGFDSGPDNGLGLKQILEKVYNTSDPTVEPVWDKLVILASDGGFEHSPSSRGYRSLFFLDVQTLEVEPVFPANDR